MSQRLKLTLTAAAFCVAVAYAGYRLMPRAPISNTVPLVCVATGETYRMTREELIAIPMKNPHTGERTLLPCHKRDGVLYVNSRYAPALAELEGKNRYVDPQTLAVRNSTAPGR